MKRYLAVFSAVLIVAGASAAWSKRRQTEYPRYEPPDLSDMPGSGLPETTPTVVEPTGTTESAAPAPSRTMPVDSVPTTLSEEKRVPEVEQLAPPLEEPRAETTTTSAAPASSVDVSPVPLNHDQAESPVPAVPKTEPAPQVAEPAPVPAEPPAPVVEAPVKEPEPVAAPAPKIAKRPAVPSARKPYRVWVWQENGDCLWRIAEKVYGDRKKWNLIYLANKDVIKDPNRVYPKQKLKIPPADWQPDVQ